MWSSLRRQCTVTLHTAFNWIKRITKNLFDPINNFLRILQKTFHVLLAHKSFICSACKLAYSFKKNSHRTLLGKFWNKTLSLMNIETFKMLVGVCFYTKCHLFLLHVKKMFWRWDNSANVCFLEQNLNQCAVTTLKQPHSSWWQKWWL